MTTDISINSPLPLAECQHRLDGVLVESDHELPFWNWPLKKMVGYREDSRILIQPRRAEAGRYSGYFVQFKGVLSARRSMTTVYGNIEIEKISPIPPILFPIAIEFLALGLYLHGFKSESLVWPGALVGIAFFTVLLAFEIVWLLKSQNILKDFYRKKIRQFLYRILGGKTQLGHH